jgi:hypothetical protein
MNNTLLRIIDSREDISDYLFHFTKNSNAQDTLNSIIESNSIIDVNDRGFICFSETPITLLTEMFKIFAKYDNPMYAPYGIAIKKDYLFELGARQVIYGSSNERQELPESLKWRFEEYVPNIRDYSWLREWRINIQEIELTPENCFIITNTKEELEPYLFDEGDIIDVEFDGCMADGRFWGNATAVIGRSFKGISIEDIEEVNSLSKSEVKRILSEQDFSDTSATGLGGFTM